MQKIAVCSFVALLAGCTGLHSPSRIAVMQNPQTKQTVECRANAWGGVPFQIQVDGCIATYKKVGYVLVADSADEAPTAVSGQP